MWALRLDLREKVFSQPSTMQRCTRTGVEDTAGTAGLMGAAVAGVLLAEDLFMVSAGVGGTARASNSGRKYSEGRRGGGRRGRGRRVGLTKMKWLQVVA